jgi:hypothetical protein
MNGGPLHKVFEPYQPLTLRESWELAVNRSHFIIGTAISYVILINMYAGLTTLIHIVG